uniref:Uncharacterized protein n=1 Tax=Fagus sylvatica TaxID=28930 RepID=A0A2N9IM57_FAGSY
METDSGGDQVGDSLDFVLDFDFDDEDLLHNPNSPMTSTHLPGETLGNLSVQEYVELGSSSGSNQPLINQTYQTNPNHNFTMSTITTSDLSNIPLEHAENLAQPAPPFNSPLIGTQQCYHPTIDNGELGSPGGHSQPQLNQENPNSNHSQHAYSENPGPPVVNTPSLPQMVPSSFNTTVVGGTQPYPPSMVGMIAPDGAHQSFHLEHEANLIYPNQLMNAQPEHMPVPQSMGPLNPCNNNNQIMQNSINNNFNNISQQPAVCPTLYPQNTIGAGVMNQRQLPINQHQATLLPNIQNAPYRHLTPMGSQSNEFMTANVFDPQYYMLPQAYALLRPQQFANQLQQFNQVPQMPNVFDPQCQYSMLPGLSMPVRSPLLANHQQQLNQVWTTQNSLQPGCSMPPRLQQSYGHQQPNQFATLMPNVFIPQVSSSMLPEQIMLSGPPQLMDHYEQANQVSMAPYASNPQQPNPTTPAPSIQPWPQGPQQSSEHQQLNKVPAMAHRVDLPHDNILPPESSIPSSLQTIQTQGLQNQTARQSVSNLTSPGTSTQQTQILNSQTQREIVNPKTKVTLPNLCETSLGSSKEKETVRKEKSLPASSAQEEDMSSQSEETEVENPNVSSPSEKRQVKNSLYDPIFEGIGQPIDPHLRLFSSSKVAS